MNPNEIRAAVSGQNEQAHSRVANCVPIHARNTLPPHRVCNTPNTFVIGMSHQSLLAAVAEMLDGEYHPCSGHWMADHINELMYRGIITGDQPYALHTSACPRTRNAWTYVLLEGHTLPAISN